MLRTEIIFIPQMDLNSSWSGYICFYFKSVFTFHKCENEGKHLQSSIKMKNSSDELFLKVGL